ncbi:MAG TPA: MFS transporter, partial [Holophaga sp.]|nr:MFS transporter [Holophaga sp.]
MDTPDTSRPSPLSPLQSRIFLAVWLASMTSNVGSLIQSVGEKWQMTQLTPSTLLVALIETGTTLPVLLFGLAAGAIADIVDRRRWLITTQVFMMTVAGVMSLLTFLHLITPMILLTMAMLIGVGSSLSMPAFQAIVPEILSKRDLGNGVALNSAGYNVSRAVGPALGGLVVGWLGAGWAFLLNAVSFLAVVAVLWKWRRKPPSHSLPSERFLGAMKVGFRYARHSRPLQIIFLRSVGYIWFSGVIFSLLPSLVIHKLGLGSAAFGLLTGCIGTGAVLLTTVLPRLRLRFQANQLLAGFTLLAVAAQGVIAVAPGVITVAISLFFAGMSWVAIFSTLNTAIQLSVPGWVKARAFGAYQMAWGGAAALA